MSTSTSTPPLLHKSLGVEGCKVVDAEHGIVEAYVSGIGNKDSGGDVIIPGAFDTHLRRRKPKGVWSHDWDKPVSKTLEIYEVAAGDPRLPLKMQLAGIGGLYVKTQFNMNTQLGRDAYETVRFYGDEAEWSIGYQVHDQEFDRKMAAMILKEIELYEYSPVLFGMNELTSTVSIKVHKTQEGELEYDITGLDELESKAVSAALRVILEEKQVTVEGEKVYAEKPWHIEKRNDEYCVIKDSDGTNEGCHDTRKEAESQMAALYASEDSKDEKTQPSTEDEDMSKPAEEEKTSESEEKSEEKVLTSTVRSALQAAARDRWEDAWVEDFDPDEGYAIVETFKYDELNDEGKYEEWKVTFTLDGDGFASFGDEAVPVTSRIERVYSELSAEEDSKEEKSEEKSEEGSDDNDEKSEDVEVEDKSEDSEEAEEKSDNSEETKVAEFDIEGIVEKISQSVVEKVMTDLASLSDQNEDSDEKSEDEEAEEKSDDSGEDSDEKSDEDSEEKSDEDSEDDSEEKSEDTSDEGSEEKSDEEADEDSSKEADEAESKDSEDEDSEDEKSEDEETDEKSDEEADEEEKSDDPSDVDFLRQLAEFEEMQLSEDT